MSDIRIFTEDLKIAQAILQGDKSLTIEYLYGKCLPLFISIYNNYYTNCENYKEFIDEIYLLIMTPSRKTGRCRLMSYRGESTLTQWLKVVCLLYCYSQFKKKNKRPVTKQMSNLNTTKRNQSDRIIIKEPSIYIDISMLNRQDAEIIIALMPNKRYSKLIHLRYIELLSDKETAAALGMTMDNYYNKHILAKKMFEKTLRKEDRHV